MTNHDKYDNRAWEGLFEFIFPDEETMTRKELQSGLKEFGVDIRPAQVKLQLTLDAALEAKKAREQLEKAKRERPSIVKKLTDIELPSFSEVRNKIEEIRRYLPGQMQTVYFRKLEDVASEKDLQALLEDISRLQKHLEDTDGIER